MGFKSQGHETDQMAALYALLLPHDCNHPIPLPPTPGEHKLAPAYISQRHIVSFLKRNIFPASSI